MRINSTNESVHVSDETAHAPDESSHAMYDETTRMDDNITEADVEATMDGHEYPNQSAGFEMTNDDIDRSVGGKATIQNGGNHESKKIFTGLDFYLLDETPKIKKIILENGGVITKKPISDFTVSNQVSPISRPPTQIPLF